MVRVLHLPTATGGNAWGLAQGEKSLGLESEVLTTDPMFAAYPADYCLNLQACRSYPAKLFKLLQAFFSVRNKYDVFHFNYGQSLIHYPQHLRLLNQLDLPFYPKKAALFVTYNGCDARQKYPTMQRCSIAACHERDCYGGMCNSGRLDELRRSAIAKMARHVSHIWALNPDLLHFLPPEKASFLPYCVASPAHEARPPSSDGPLRILHLPSAPVTKGSIHVQRAIEKLLNRYGPKDVVFTYPQQRVSHTEAKALIAACDVLVDQLLIGWYGAVAVEAMFLGKAVIARIEGADLSFVPSEMARDLRESMLWASPTSIESVLEYCIQDRNRVIDKARAGLDYAHRWHQSEQVAAISKGKYLEKMDSRHG